MVVNHPFRESTKRGKTHRRQCRLLRGAKANRTDAERTAKFLQAWVIEGKLRSTGAIRELRDMARVRVRRQQDGNRVINRIG